MTDSRKLEWDGLEGAVLFSRRDVLTGAIAISASFAAGPASGLVATPSQPATTSRQGITKEALAQLFRNPPQEFAPIDNWWWEGGKVDREKLVLQLKDLKDKGIGGTWFYVRWVYGESLSSIPHYWTEQWWDLTR